MSTASKLLVILTLLLLPIGLGLAWVGHSGIRRANDALDERNEAQSKAAAGTIESLIARNALALRIAANGALVDGGAGACDKTRRSLSIAPAVAQSFELESPDGTPLCAVGDAVDSGTLPLVAPGAIRTRIAPDRDAVAIRVGVINGMATAAIGVDELRTALLAHGSNVRSLMLHDDVRQLRVLGTDPSGDSRLTVREQAISNGNISARTGVPHERITTPERLMLLLPLLMWIAAALVTWLLVSRLLVQPLRKLGAAVLAYQPGAGTRELPSKLGPSEEIRELRDAFARTIDRVEESEQEATAALEGQRRLVREVHHRVKNNLQVVASLLNIHSRSAETSEARAAYAGISRRVGALSIVHRNHFAEMEDNRGIALRPLVTELAAELRASAPESARKITIELEVDSIYTTQDVAVAVGFLVTEIVEYAIINAPSEAIELSLRRTSELTGRLSLSSPILVPDDSHNPDKVQFERIVAGLAKQLRSPLERKLGRYSVDLPIFPPA